MVRDVVVPAPMARTVAEFRLVAVIPPAAKLPEPSRATMELDTLDAVAVVAELATLLAVVSWASLVSAMAAEGSTSALTIKDDVNSPLASLWRIPAVVNCDIVMPVNPPVLLPNEREVARVPAMLMAPAKSKLGVLRLFNVIVFAEKLPETSRATIANAVLTAVAVVAELATLPAVAMVANFVSAMAAAASTSALTIKDDVNAPLPAAL
jgi:hypothetical protein